MNWQIPAKTFLLGEYAAIAGQSAIIITTEPYFEFSITNQESPNKIHPLSPAGLWLAKQKEQINLAFADPYHGIGGLGASSAQFLAVYLATSQQPSLDELCTSYDETAWSGKGLRPSAYDLIAQSQRGLVFINKQKKIIESYTWPFSELAFFLIHTGFKLATHNYLEETTIPNFTEQTEHLSAIVDTALEAFKTAEAKKLTAAVNAYHKKLVELGLVAKHSLNLIQKISTHTEVLAIKGCGALGADVLIILCDQGNKYSLKDKLLAQNFQILATESQLSLSNSLMIAKKNS